MRRLLVLLVGFLSLTGSVDLASGETTAERRELEQYRVQHRLLAQQLPARLDLMEATLESSVVTSNAGGAPSSVERWLLWRIEHLRAECDAAALDGSASKIAREEARELVTQVERLESEVERVLERRKDKEQVSSARGSDGPALEPIWKARSRPVGEPGQSSSSLPGEADSGSLAAAARKQLRDLIRLIRSNQRRCTESDRWMEMLEQTEMLETRLGDSRFRTDPRALQAISDRQQRLRAGVWRLANPDHCRQEPVEINRAAVEKAGAGSIAGTVSASNGGAGLEGVQVFIWDSSGDRVGDSWTDATGSYAVADLDDGTYFSSTWTDIGYINQLYSGSVCLGCDVLSGTAIDVVNGEAVTGIDFVLDPGGTISGTVTDASLGNGLAGVWIHIFDESGSMASHGDTDGTGAFTTWEAVPPGNYYAKTWSDIGYVDKVYDDKPCLGDCDVMNGDVIVVSGTENVSGIDFALEPGGPVSGTVIEASSGTGLADVGIDVFDESGKWVGNGVTDGMGAYTTYFVYPAGNYFVRTWNNAGFADELYDNIPCQDSCDVTAGDAVVHPGAGGVTGIDFDLAQGTTVSGRVTDNLTGTGLFDARVMVFDSEGSFVNDAWTDEQGDFTVDGLSGGVFFARASTQHYFTQLYDGIDCTGGCVVNTGTPIPAAEGEQVVAIDFALVRGGSISGTVTDSATGAPLEGAFVAVWDGGEIFASEHTAPNGLYNISVALPQGQYFVTASGGVGYVVELYDDISCAGLCDPTAGDAISVGPGEVVAGINFALEAGASIAGIVTDQITQAGIADVRVDIFDVTGEWVTSANTEADGSYITPAELPEGTYFACTWNDQGYLEELFDGMNCSMGCDVTQGDAISVGLGEEVTGINFELSRGASISGVVTDAQTQAGIQDIHVDIYDAAGEFVTWGNTEADGSYVTPAELPEGTYFASTWNNQGYLDELYDGLDCSAGCDVTTGDEIVVPAGAHVTGVDFALSEASFIAGDVTDASDGTPLEGVRVYIYDQGGNFVVTGMSGADGRYETLSSMAPGTYFARTWNNQGYLDELFDNIPYGSVSILEGTPIEVLQGQTSSADFALYKGGTIAGTVTDSFTTRAFKEMSVVYYHSGGGTSPMDNPMSTGASFRRPPCGGRLPCRDIQLVRLYQPGVQDDQCVVCEPYFRYTHLRRCRRGRDRD